MKSGIVLVLFVLLVIAESLFRGPARGEAEDGNVTVQETKGFNVYNKSKRQPFILRATSFEGDFASPTPSVHTLHPGESYHFEVKRFYFYVSEAYVTYALLDMNEIPFGNARLKMKVDTHASSTTVQSIKITKYYPVGIENGGTYFNFINK